MLCHEKCCVRLYTVGDTTACYAMKRVVSDCTFSLQDWPSFSGTQQAIFPQHPPPMSPTPSASLPLRQTAFNHSPCFWTLLHISHTPVPRLINIIIDFAVPEIMAGKPTAIMVVEPGCTQCDTSRKEAMNCSWAELVGANGTAAKTK